MRLYAQRKDWPLGAVTVKVTHRRDLSSKPIDIFDRVLTLGGELDAEQRQRLMEIAEMCPVHKMLTAGAAVSTTLA
jgi:putative redox protein